MTPPIFAMIQAKSIITFKTSHHIPGSALLHNSHILVQIGREVALSGNFYDYDEGHNSWVGEVSGFQADPLLHNTHCCVSV